MALLRKRRSRALSASQAVCGLCILLLAVNVAWEYVGVCYVAPDQAWGVYVGSGYGALVAGWTGDIEFSFLPYSGTDGFDAVAHPHDRHWVLAWDVARHVAFYPRADFPARLGGQVSLPLWIPLFLSSVLLFVRWRGLRRERAAGACTGCGYDLTGNESGRCPECGAAASGSAARKLEGKRDRGAEYQ